MDDAGEHVVTCCLPGCLDSASGCPWQCGVQSRGMQKRAQSPALANETGSREIPGWVVIASPEILGQEPSSGQRVLTNTPTLGARRCGCRLPPSLIR